MSVTPTTPKAPPIMSPSPVAMEERWLVLHQAGLALAQALGVEDVLKTTLQYAMRLAEADAGAIWMRRGQPPAKTEQVEPSQEASQRAPLWLMVRAIAGELPSEPVPARLEGAALAVQETATIQILEEQDTKCSIVAIPLICGDSICGVLELQKHAHEDEAASHTLAANRDLLASLCEQAAISLRSARLFQQLQNAKREWEVTFDGILDGVGIERSDGTVLRANRALAALLDLNIDQIVGRNRQELLEALPNFVMLRPLQRAENAPPGLRVRTAEFRFGSPERIISETIFTLRFIERRRRARSKASLDTKNDGHRVCLLRDITSQRRLQDQLLQSEKLAALGELVSGVAHELNNPLTTVVGYAQLLQDDDQLSETVRRQMGIIHAEAARASRIVQNLLAFARREEPRMQRLNINDTLRSVVQMRAYQLQAHNTRVHADYGNNVPAVWGDPHQLQQVFLNIINNAHQAMQEWRGGGEIHISTQATSVGEATGVLIRLSDNGPGIAPEYLRRVFDPFFTTKELGEGTGLGMSISLSIINNHQGRIWAESTLGHGAAFLIELPGMLVTRDSSSDDLEEMVQDVAVNAQVETPRQILVVDDEEPVVTLITEVLNLDGHWVTPAFNGAEALALLQEYNYDLIVSDVRMPAVGGPAFFEILQTIRPDLLPRVVFVTGDTVSPSTQEFLRRSGRPMLTKPFDPERLRAMVSKTLKEIQATEMDEDTTPVLNQ